MHVSVPHVYSALLGQKRMFNNLGFAAYYELPYGYSELNQGTLREHTVLLATEPSFQHHFGFISIFPQRLKIVQPCLLFTRLERRHNWHVTDLVFPVLSSRMVSNCASAKIFQRLSPISVSLHLCYVNASSSSAHPNTIFLFTHKHYPY